MKAQAQVDLTAPPASSPARLYEDHKFEAIFRIPANHTLLVVRSRSRGGPVGSVRWEHEEYDASGLLVARYESFAEMNPVGLRLSGWCKYDLEGNPIGEGEWLA